ncbi:hypothetical protein VTN96DRAFT_1087 [Rasamsonia emersonii]
MATRKSPQDQYRPPCHGIFRVLPASWIPYAELMRLDRPAGYYAFYWHYGIGLSFGASVCRPLAAPATLVMLAVYLALWVVILRGAVCTVNDNLDQDFDRQVARTRFRPIARGAVSTGQGYLFALAQFALGAAILLPLPPKAAIHAATTAAILAVYPLAKRVTDFPQVILGLGFAVAVFVSCAALNVDPLDDGHRPATLSLFGACAIWTIIFDTIYAHQDRRDDVRAGVRSLAVLLGERTKLALSMLAALQVGLLAVVGFHSGFSPVYFVTTCGGTSLALTAMMTLVDLKKPASCAWWFGPGSSLVGACIVAGLASEYLWKWYYL